MLNEEQLKVVDVVMESIQDENAQPRCFFIDGPGGTGKTFVYETLYYLMRGSNLKVKNMAYTGMYHSLYKMNADFLMCDKTVDETRKENVPSGSSTDWTLDKLKHELYITLSSKVEGFSFHDLFDEWRLNYEKNLDEICSKLFGDDLDVEEFICANLQDIITQEDGLNGKIFKAVPVDEIKHVTMEMEKSKKAKQDKALKKARYTGIPSWRQSNPIARSSKHVDGPITYMKSSDNPNMGHVSDFKYESLNNPSSINSYATFIADDQVKNNNESPEEEDDDEFKPILFEDCPEIARIPKRKPMALCDEYGRPEELIRKVSYLETENARYRKEISSLNNKQRDHLETIRQIQMQNMEQQEIIHALLLEIEALQMN